MTQVVQNKMAPFHVEMLLDSSENRLPEGCRLSTKSWKTPAAQKNNKDYKLRPAVCVAVPLLPVSVQPVVLQSALQSAFEGLQDRIISEAIDAAILEDTGVNLASVEIASNSITYEGVAEWSAQQAVKGRLSGAQIEAWFDLVLGDLVEIKLAEINGITEDQMQRGVKQHRENFAKLASPKAVMPEKLTLQLQRALKLLDGRGQDKIRNVLDARLASFLKPVEFADMIELPED